MIGNRTHPPSTFVFAKAAKRVCRHSPPSATQSHPENKGREENKHNKALKKGRRRRRRREGKGEDAEERLEEANMRGKNE